MKKLYFIVGLVLLTLIVLFSNKTINTYRDDNIYQEVINRYDIDIKMKTLWDKAKIDLNKSAMGVNNTPIELYFLGMNSKNILDYAFIKKDKLLIDELLSLYLDTLSSLKYTNKYKFIYLEENKVSPKILENFHYMWLDKEGKEELIPSAQFLFIISKALQNIATIPSDKQSKTMKIFTKKFIPIVLDHYSRWIMGVQEKDKPNKKLGVFGRRGWGCKDKNENYIYSQPLMKFESKLEGGFHGNSYCNVVDDSLLLTTTGLGYLLSSKKYAKDFYTVKEEDELKKFFQKSAKYISQNFQKSVIDSKEILSFQIGAWYGHPDYDYSNYSGLNFPLETNKKSNKHIGTDISHARRLLSFLELLLEHKNYFKLEFPSQDEMKMFTDGFYYNVFNQDFTQPLFKNYMDGSNGWFRVNYSSRSGYGYAPYNLTSTALTSGYVKLGKYNPELKKIFEILIKKLNSSTIIDQKFIEKNYENTVWSDKILKTEYHFYEENIDAKTALFLMNFYATLYFK